MKQKSYRFSYNGEKWLVFGDDKDDAIFLFHCEFGFPEEFIREHFTIRRVY